MALQHGMSYDGKRHAGAQTSSPSIVGSRQWYVLFLTDGLSATIPRIASIDS